MSSLINKIEQLIKREKSSPDKKKKEDENKSSSEILSELFGAFNADPPKIDEYASRKSKKSKKKHKKEKKKRSRSSSTDDNEHTPKRKKRKKSKSKKRKHSDSSDDTTPPRVKIDPDLVSVKKESTKPFRAISVKTEDKDVKPKIPIKHEDKSSIILDATMIPMPQSPQDTQLDDNDLRYKLENKKSDQNISDTEKSKGKIQIKNLKFSAVFEETVKKAEEEARKKAEKYEEGEYSSSLSTEELEEESNSQFPKSSDPGGILKKTAEDKLSEDEKKHKRTRHSESSHKSSRRDRSRSRKRSRSKTRHRSSSRTRHSSRSRHTSRSRHSSRSRHTSRSDRRSRSSHRSRSGHRARHTSPRTSSYRTRRSPTGVRLADSEKKRLLEVARRNAINMLKNGAVPGSAAALPLHTRNQVMAAIQSGGKSVDELTDFCKHLSKKEALGELSSVESNDEGDSENEDTLAFHHPFLVKEKGPIVMNIRGGVPLPTKSSSLPIVNKDELTKQFPVSSGTQHRDKAIEWVPVSPKKDSNTTANTNDMQVARIEKPAKKEAPKPVPPPPVPPAPVTQFALPGPAAANDTPVLAPFMKHFKPSEPLSTVSTLGPALPAPGPQAYPPGVRPHNVAADITSLVSAKLSMIRKEQEQNELVVAKGFGWSAKDRNLGHFTGSTGANILTPKELASGTQAWAKKDQLTRAAPVAGGMGMALLQKMGWTPGQGLGKEGTGTLQPLLLEVKLDTRGLQAREESGGRQRGAKQRVPGAPGKPRGAGPAPLVAGNKHPVSLLGEYCSKNKLGPPEYDLCFESGPDHKKHFLFKVKVNNVEYQPAVASANKKQAKADAAQLALQKLGILT